MLVLTAFSAADLILSVPLEPRSPRFSNITSRSIGLTWLPPSNAPNLGHDLLGYRIVNTYLGKYRGLGIYDVKGSVPILFLKLHHRGERGRKGRECKFQNISHRTLTS